MSSSPSQPIMASSSSQPIIDFSSSRPIMASTSPQPIMASSSKQPMMTSSSSQSMMASSSSQPMMASSSSQLMMAPSSSQPMMASSSSQLMMAPSSSQPIMASSSSQPMDDLTLYMPLHKYILEGDLESVKRDYDSDDHALEARITANFDTALHVAVGAGMAKNIVEYLLDTMSDIQMAMVNNEGNTVLSIAAIVGNVQAAKQIINKLPDLNIAANSSGWIPLFLAARHAQKEMITYLLKFNEPYLLAIRSTEDKAGAFFVNLLIIAEFYDLAVELVNRNSRFATTELYGGESLLKTLAGQPSAFPSEVVEFDTSILFAVQLVKCLCTKITSKLDHERASSVLKQPLLLAAELGVHEVVEEIVKSFPDAIWFSDAENHNALQIAVLNRREKVFNLLKQMSGCKNMLMMSEDTSGNNILHLAGKLAPEYQLNQIAGAALQMQRELQCFQVL
ncbi:hypothetical protein Pint_12021 [Pistacia integerrima]|uniref:Uncharacterized protein n=1 Tax=Pistacia integerrima TaxID=434235 RepID=A0ACC0XJM1_9ROSI|nr:hypothetical protein Pint_12021 [Pistacia integerrima]